MDAVQQKMHISFLELTAIQLALKAFYILVCNKAFQTTWLQCILFRSRRYSFASGVGIGTINRSLGQLSPDLTSSRASARGGQQLYVPALQDTSQVLLQILSIDKTKSCNPSPSGSRLGQETTYQGCSLVNRSTQFPCPGNTVVN